MSHSNIKLKYIYILILKFITENIKLLNVIDNKKKRKYDQSHISVYNRLLYIIRQFIIHK